MIACTNLSAPQTENSSLKEVVLIAIKAGQDLPDKKPEDILPTINRRNIIPIINVVADESKAFFSFMPKYCHCVLRNGSILYENGR